MSRPPEREQVDLRLERLSLFAQSLEEFQFGHEMYRLEPGQGEGELAPASKRFYFNSMVQYVSSYFLAEGGATELGWLRDAGLGHFADRVEQLLARKVGPTTVRERLADYRNKLLTHFRYTHAEVEALKRKHDVESNRRAYGAALTELFDLTREIAVEVGAIREALRRGDIP